MALPLPLCTQSLTTQAIVYNIWELDISEIMPIWTTKTRLESIQVGPFIQVLLVRHPFITAYARMFCITKCKYHPIENKEYFYLITFCDIPRFFSTPELSFYSIFQVAASYFHWFEPIHSHVLNNTILFPPLPSIVVRFPPPSTTRSPLSLFGTVTYPVGR